MSQTWPDTRLGSVSDWSVVAGTSDVTWPVWFQATFYRRRQPDADTATTTTTNGNTNSSSSNGTTTTTTTTSNTYIYPTTTTLLHVSMHGELLVNHQPVGHLPTSIREHKLFVRFFGTHDNFEVSFDQSK